MKVPPHRKPRRNLCRSVSLPRKPAMHPPRCLWPLPAVCVASGCQFYAFFFCSVFLVLLFFVFFLPKPTQMVVEWWCGTCTRAVWGMLLMTLLTPDDCHRAPCFASRVRTTAASCSDRVSDLASGSVNFFVVAFNIYFYLCDWVAWCNTRMTWGGGAAIKFSPAHACTMS